MTRQCSQIPDQPLHRRVLYLFSVSRAMDIHLRYRLIGPLVDVADERLASVIDPPSSTTSCRSCGSGAAPCTCRRAAGNSCGRSAGSCRRAASECAGTSPRFRRRSRRGRERPPAHAGARVLRGAGSKRRRRVASPSRFSGQGPRGRRAAASGGERSANALASASSRINEAFGDVVNWDLIPTVAIGSRQLVAICADRDRLRRAIAIALRHRRFKTWR
jgi:hypothetical protein